MKILPVDKVREADAFTIENEPIASIDLMERAASRLYERIKPRIAPGMLVRIFAGIGNNGGDGLVLARLFARDGLDAEVWVAAYSETCSVDFTENLKRLEPLGIQVNYIQKESQIPDIHGDNLVIDALFGSGLNRPVEGFTAKLIERINESGAVVIAVDIPSGLFADKAVDARRQSIIKADYTYTFEFPKLAFLMPENDMFVGRWEIVPIGLHADFIENVDVSNSLVTKWNLRSFLKGRAKFAHKGKFGHALLIAGSRDMTGAAVLAAGACLRAGVGLLHVHLPKNREQVLWSHFPEAMVSIDESEACFTTLPKFEPFSAIGIGPGLGQEGETAKALKLLIQQTRLPLVLDADALNLLAANPTWLSFLPPGSVLTPHPGEFERLAGKWSDGFERLQMQRNFSVRYKLYVVCKGAHTAITTPLGHCWFNTTGNPGMAKGGSGDVLTGMILGLLARGYTSLEAALLGVYIHGMAGDLAVQQCGMESLLPSDIIQNIGKAFMELYSPTKETFRY